METFWRMLNGPDGVCSDTPSARTGKEKREKTRIAASLKDFLSLINTDTFGSVFGASRRCVDEVHDGMSLSGGGACLIRPEMTEYSKAKTELLSGESVHHRLHILHMYMYTYTVWI